MHARARTLFLELAEAARARGRSGRQAALNLGVALPSLGV